MKSIPLQKGLVFLAGIVFAAGCASKPQHEVKVDTGSSATEQIAEADGEMMNLKNTNADVLAPEPYAKAQKALQKAKNLSEAKKAPEKISEQVALSTAWAADAREQSQMVQNRLSSVLESRKFAMHANAPNLFPSRWKDAEAQLSKTARSARESSEAVTDKVVDLDRAYLTLEKEAVAKNSLDPAQQTLEKARKEGANTYAPRSLKEAQLQFDQSLASVKGSPRNELEVQHASTLAQQKADYVLEVTRRAKNNSGATSEDLIRTNMAAQTKARDLAAAGAEVRSERDEAEQRAAALESALAATPEPEESLSDMTNEVRKLFTAAEADVYTEGTAVLIRLKGLRFASGQSQISSSQYALLAKVNDALDMFDRRRIQVQGHTDSTGSAATNRQLSQDRADNVRSYLVSTNGDLESSEITAQGFGDERPLGSNRTNDGRAMNRRIDIVIDTQ